MDKKKMVPELRFGEFDSGWLNCRLEKLCSKTVSYGIVQTGDNLDEGIPCLRVVDLARNSNTKCQMIKTSEEINLSYSKTILEKDELVLALRGDIGLSMLITEELAGINITRGLARLSPSDDVDSKFLFFSLQSPKLKKELNRRVNGSALQEIPLKSLRESPVIYPKIKEQQKIANFLTAIDQRITLLKQKKAALEQYKKGLMQKIFSQEVRFLDDEGNDFPDWEESNVGAEFEFQNGKAHEQSVSEDGQFVIVNSKFVSTNGVVRKFSKEQILPLYKEEIVLVMSDVPNGKALASCFFINEDDKFTLNQRICALRTKNGISKFLFYLIHRNKYYLRFDSGVGQTNLRKQDVLDCPLTIPADSKEQQKIADCLSAIDQSINQLSKQIDQTTQFKKGLLQRMFV